ncbi:osteocrin [Melanotaenia boesemani]|uniref:osteocrin n=1 Tax=Melanotaenia boesemani TaxID=1250792 RepID=UPI001C04853B|nr:osteocrin [Melanotaenia boesemani]
MTKQQSSTVKMQLCSCLVVSWLLSTSLLDCRVHGIRVQHYHVQHHPGGVKLGEELTAKLLRLDNLMRMQNDVMEPKRKRSFPGNNAPMDRLSVSSMETKQGTNRQSKVGELPRRRTNPSPIDRIGMSRLPNSRG